MEKNFSKMILLISLIFGGIFIKTNLGDFKQLTVIDISIIPFLILISLFTFPILGLINKIILDSLKTSITLTESTLISIMNSFYNLITPFRGGIATRAVYLKKKYNLTYTEFLSTVATTSLLLVFASGILGLIATISIYLQTNILSKILLLIFLAMTVLSIIIILFSPKIKETKTEFINKFIRLINAWHSIRKNKKIIFTTLILTIIQILFASLMLKLQFGVFGVQIDFIQALFLSAIAGASIVISITPANLGVSEAIIVFSAQTIGISPIHSLSAALIGRLIQFIILFTLGPIATYKLMKNEKNN
jgi:uncharacterized protein (TIRG00374 family)